ncbi:MAG: winged helix-turn-helix transcriptional regulator [Fusobacteriaceae bacterium]|nr:winged helix-turn-helix transcriptional regulator [Fusobacteriaceae bacterium]
MYKDIADNFGSISRRTQNLFRNNLEDKFISKGLQAYIIVICDNEGAIADEITKILKVDKGTTARAIAKLEKEKYILRVQDENDKRKYKLYSTDKSKELYAKIVALYYNIAEEALNILDEKEEKELLRILGKVRAHIKEIDDR